ERSSGFERTPMSIDDDRQGSIVCECSRKEVVSASGRIRGQSRSDTFRGGYGSSHPALVTVVDEIRHGNRRQNADNSDDKHQFNQHKAPLTLTHLCTLYQQDAASFCSCFAFEGNGILLVLLRAALLDMTPPHLLPLPIAEHNTLL